MWERKKIKERGKQVVHKNYWTAIVVCFLIALFTGEFGTSTLGIWQEEDSLDSNYIIHQQEYEIDSFFTKRDSKEALTDTQLKIAKATEANLNSILRPQKYIFKIWDAITSFHINQPKLGIGLSIGAVIALVFTILVADPLIVGGKKYFINAQKGKNARVRNLGEVFQKEHWINVVVIMFLRNLYNALWYLTIVGGVIKTYEYRMIPYLLAENPNMKRKEAFHISKQMMKGNKWRVFVLDISFFGWYFLSVLTFGLLSILYVNPYNVATNAELYVELKQGLEDIS